MFKVRGNGWLKPSDGPFWSSFEHGLSVHHSSSESTRTCLGLSGAVAGFQPKTRSLVSEVDSHYLRALVLPDSF